MNLICSLRKHSFLTTPNPLILGGYLIFEIWTKREVIKNCSEIGGVVESGGGEGGGILLERGGFQIVLSVFLKKSMFSLLLEFSSGKYSHLL